LANGTDTNNFIAQTRLNELKAYAHWMRLNSLPNNARGSNYSFDASLQEQCQYLASCRNLGIVNSSFLADWILYMGSLIPSGHPQYLDDPNLNTLVGRWRTIDLPRGSNTHTANQIGWGTTAPITDVEITDNFDNTIDDIANNNLVPIFSSNVQDIDVSYSITSTGQKVSNLVQNMANGHLKPKQVVNIGIHPNSPDSRVEYQIFVPDIPVYPKKMDIGCAITKFDCAEEDLVNFSITKIGDDSYCEEQYILFDSAMPNNVNIKNEELSFSFPSPGLYKMTVSRRGGIGMKASLHLYNTILYKENPIHLLEDKEWIGYAANDMNELAPEKGFYQGIKRDFTSLP
jgi:hypothetical protein